MAYTHISHIYVLDSAPSKLRLPTVVRICKFRFFDSMLLQSIFAYKFLWNTFTLRLYFAKKKHWM